MEQQGKKGFAITSLVLGIVSIILAWFYGINILGIVTGAAGLVFAILAGKSYKAIGQKNGIATAGLVLSIIGLALSIIGFFACTVCVCCTAQAINDAAASGDLQELASELSQLQ